MANPTLDIDDLLDTPDHPRFIAGVFNYCNRRCGRCSLSDRCRLYASEQRDQEVHPDDPWTTRVHRSFQRTLELIRRWCDKEGVDIGERRVDAMSADVTTALRISEVTRQDPLQRLAEQYAFAALKLAEALRRAARFNSWPGQAQEAVETIESLAIPVSSKVHRALTGYARRDGEDSEIDGVQTDWNGSAKVARLGIAESRVAWSLLLTAGRAAADSPMRQLLEQLEQIDAGIAERFPRAMEFVRPGFDDLVLAAIGSASDADPALRPRFLSAPNREEPPIL